MIRCLSILSDELELQASAQEPLAVRNRGRDESLHHEGDGRAATQRGHAPCLGGLLAVYVPLRLGEEVGEEVEPAKPTLRAPITKVVETSAQVLELPSLEVMSFASDMPPPDSKLEKHFL